MSDPIQLLTEPTVTPPEAANFLKVHLSTLYTYMGRGRKLPNGEVLVLENFRMGNSRRIPVHKLREFAAKFFEGFSLCKVQQLQETPQITKTA